MLMTKQDVKKRATSVTWETVPIDKHIYANLLLYHNADVERKKSLSHFVERNGHFLPKNVSPPDTSF